MTKCGICLEKKCNFCDICNIETITLQCYGCDNYIKICRGYSCKKLDSCHFEYRRVFCSGECCCDFFTSQKND